MRMVRPNFDMNIHELKTWPEYFQEVDNGNKPFEIRKNDRGFEVGDELLLMEWNPETEAYTGRGIAKRVTYMTDFRQRGNFVVLGIADIPSSNDG